MASFKPMTRQAVTKPDTTPNYIKKLREITAKDVNALTPADVEYLHARRSYLSDDELKKVNPHLKELEDKRAKKEKLVADMKASQKKVKK